MRSRRSTANPAGGLARQRMIQRVMERIVDQTIPQVVINNPRVDWSPAGNEVKPSPVNDLNTPAQAGADITTRREPDTRYARLLANLPCGAVGRSVLTSGVDVHHASFRA